MKIKNAFSAVDRVRMAWCAAYAAVTLVAVWLVSPQQVPVILYKLSLVLLAALTGYWLDRWAFPYARPYRFLTDGGDVRANHKRVFAATQLRRALIMAGAMLAVGMGL